ncbi:MAG TPA: arsenate reductase ArsC [Devosiaceae bacterium]|jgi:arsenate reductase|nr:arsenate reductase ArsC [Devosiaceae bacterium]
MPDRVYNVLFLCTGNSARSILGEVLLNQLGDDRFKAYSAGSHPRGAVHPATLELLRDEGLPTEGLRSKSWDEFALPGAPVMDFVFTVCDDAAGEACPIWPGQPMTAHWGIEDPAREVGTPVIERAAFVQAFRYMRNRILAFTSLPLASIDRMTLQNQVRAIGSMPGASRRKQDVA